MGETRDITLFWYGTLIEAAVGISRRKSDSDINVDIREMEYHVKVHPQNMPRRPRGGVEV